MSFEIYMFISLVFAPLLSIFFMLDIIPGSMNSRVLKIINVYGHQLFCIVLFPLAEMMAPYF